MPTRITRRAPARRAPARRAPARRAPARRASAPRAGFVKVEYGYPGRDGLKAGIVAVGTTHADALRQLGIEANQTKEGIISKLNGSSIKFTDVVSEGVFMICPGVDSSY